MNLKGEEDKAPIHLAAQSCNREILMKLLENPAIHLEEKDIYGNLATHDAEGSNWAEGFLMITQKMAQKREKRRVLLHNTISLIKKLIENASQQICIDTSQNNENCSSNTHKPTFSNDMVPSKTEIEEKILQFTDDIIFTKNQMGLCCFHVAAIKNCAEIFDCLEKKYPTIAQKIYKYQSGLTGYTVLHYLAMRGHSELLDKVLTNLPAIVNEIEGIDGIVSPLYLASKFNQENCVKVLIKHGANIQKLAKKQRDIKT